MGVYYHLIVKTKKENYEIQSLKYSLGAALYAFDNESFVYVHGETYYVKTTINKALNNLDDFKNEILNTMNSSYLDEWSRNFCLRKTKEIEETIEKLKKFEKNDILFCDMTDGVVWGDYENSEDFNPSRDLIKNRQFSINIASGKYNGKNTDYNILYNENNYINSIIKEILENKNIKIKRISYSSISMGNISAINMGQKRIFRCTTTLIFEKEEKVKSYEEIEYYTLPIFETFQKKDIFLEVTFDKTYEKINENEIAYKCNLYW